MTLLIGVVLLAAAPERPLIASHPLEVSGVSGRAAQEVVDDFFIELARQPFELVTNFEVEQALAAQRCADGDLTCLGALARVTGATLALWVSVQIEEERYRLRALAVSPAGAGAREPVELTVPKDVTAPRSPQLRAAFKALLEKLSLERAPEPPKPAEPPTPVVTVTPVVVAPAERPLPLSTRLGLLSGGAALIAGASAVGIAIANNSIAAGVRDRAYQGHVLMEDVGAVRAVDRNTALAAGLGVGAGVLAVVAAVLFALPSGEPAPVSAGASFSSSGAHVVLTGVFP